MSDLCSTCLCYSVFPRRIDDTGDKLTFEWDAIHQNVKNLTFDMTNVATWESPSQLSVTLRFGTSLIRFTNAFSYFQLPGPSVDTLDLRQLRDLSVASTPQANATDFATSTVPKASNPSYFPSPFANNSKYDQSSCYRQHLTEARPIPSSSIQSPSWNPAAEPSIKQPAAVGHPHDPSGPLPWFEGYALPSLPTDGLSTGNGISFESSTSSFPILRQNTGDELRMSSISSSAPGMHHSGGQPSSHLGVPFTTLRRGIPAQMNSVATPSVHSNSMSTNEHVAWNTGRMLPKPNTFTSVATSASSATVDGISSDRYPPGQTNIVQRQLPSESKAKDKKKRKLEDNFENTNPLPTQTPSGLGFLSPEMGSILYTTSGATKKQKISHGASVHPDTRGTSIQTPMPGQFKNSMHQQSQVSRTGTPPLSDGT